MEGHVCDASVTAIVGQIDEQDRGNVRPGRRPDQDAIGHDLVFSTAHPIVEVGNGDRARDACGDALRDDVGASDDREDDHEITDSWASGRPWKPHERVRQRCVSVDGRCGRGYTHGIS